MIIEDILTVTMNSRREIDRFSILIEGEKISSLSKRRFKRRPGDYVLEGSRKIALPGLINGHIHSDVTLARGLGDGYSLYEQDNDSFISRKKWFRNELDEEARYYSRLLSYAEAVKGGTTFICDVPFWWYEDDLAAPLREIGIKGAVVLDYRKDFLKGTPIKKKVYFKAAEHLLNSGFMPIVEAPAEEDYEPQLLLRLRDWAEELDTPIQMHLAETRWRGEIVHRKFCRTSIEYLNDIHFLNRRVIGSHGVYINREELRILKETGVKIVNCPVAEMKISDGIAPVVQLIKAAIPVGLGTDGALWNDSSDMFSEMKSLMLLQRVAGSASSISPYECLYSATAGGAKVFNLEGELGSIEEGKRACIVIVDFFNPHMLPLYHGEASNVLQNLTSCTGAADVDTVIIDGKIIVEKGKLKTIDEGALLHKCQELGESRFKNLVNDE